MFGKVENEEKKEDGEVIVQGDTITKEMAEKELKEWMDANDIDSDKDGMDEDRKSTFESFWRMAIRAMQKGRLVVDGLKLKYTISKFSPEGYRGVVLDIVRPEGRLFTAMDGRKDTESMAKLEQGMSAMVGKDIGWLKKIDVSDWRFISSTMTLFLF